MSKHGYVDPALLDLFRAELDTHLPQLAEGLLALERDPDQPRRLEALMRAAHSVKGAARIVGVDDAVQVAHALEDCFVAAQKGQITLGSDAIDVLLAGVDALGRVCSETGLPAEAVRAGIEAVNAVRQGQARPAAKPTTTNDPFQPSGRLTAEAAETMRRALVEHLRANRPITLDFTAVTDLEPAALHVVARALHARPPITITAHDGIAQLLRLTRLLPSGA